MVQLSQAVPSRTNMAQTALVRQPYSEAVPSTEKGGFPLLPWGEKTEMRGGAFFNGKEGRDDFRKTSFWLKGDGGIRKNFFNGKEGRVGFRKKGY